jgi:ribosome-binding protein aMBF1 (putative translation factor)
MRNIDMSKLHNTNELLECKYGKRGTPGREAFESRALAYFFGEILKNKRKELKLTQQQLANKIGRERSYIARVEKGQTDIQLPALYGYPMRWD